MRCQKTDTRVDSCGFMQDRKDVEIRYERKVALGAIAVEEIGTIVTGIIVGKHGDDTPKPTTISDGRHGCKVSFVMLS